MGDQFSNRVEIANEVKLNSASKYGVITVGTVATQIIGTVAEIELLITADANIADVLYIGLDNTVSSTNYATFLTAGEKMAFTISETDPVEIWVIGTNASDKVAYLEGVA